MYECTTHNSNKNHKEYHGFLSLLISNFFIVHKELIEGKNKIFSNIIPYEFKLCTGLYHIVYINLLIIGIKTLLFMTDHEGKLILF